MKEIYTNFHKYVYTWIRKLIQKLKTLDISTTLFDNVAFVFFHVMEIFSKAFFLGSAWVEKSRVSAFAA